METGVHSPRARGLFSAERIAFVGHARARILKASKPLKNKKDKPDTKPTAGPRHTLIAL